MSRLYKHVSGIPIAEFNELLISKIKLQIELIKHLEDQIKVQQEYIDLLKLRPVK